MRAPAILDTSIEIRFDDGRTCRPQVAQREQLRDVMPNGRWRDLVGKRLIIQSRGRGIPVSMRILDEWDTLSDVLLAMELGAEPADDVCVTAMGTALANECPF
jgi:hypothetical protein